MLGRETKLGARVECMAEVSGRPGASKQVEFRRVIPCHPRKAIWFQSAATAKTGQTPVSREIPYIHKYVKPGPTRRTKTPLIKLIIAYLRQKPFYGREG